MYGQALRADDPEYLAGDYSPTTAYARSKRAQVELLPLLARRWAGAGSGVHATHPGWADTPGVDESLPRFHRLTGPLLRDAEGGADTTVWLAATDPQPRSGQLWHDRRSRPTHLLRRTRTDESSATRCGTGSASRPASRLGRAAPRPRTDRLPLWRLATRPRPSAPTATGSS